MNHRLFGHLRAGVFKKQVVAVTGLFMVLFLIAHMAGNLFIFGGPEAFNGYAEKVRALGPFLWLERAALLTAFSVHIGLTIQLSIENRAARGGRYAISDFKGDGGFAKRTMLLSGSLVFFFVLLHLKDFTFTDHHGPGSVIKGVANGEELGLYGLVWNSFLKPWRSVVYLAAMGVVGLHLIHGVQSLFQSLGARHEDYTPWVVRGGIILAVILAVGFSLAPLYISIVRTPRL